MVTIERDKSKLRPINISLENLFCSIFVKIYFYVMRTFHSEDVKGLRNCIKHIHIYITIPIYYTVVVHFYVQIFGLKVRFLGWKNIHFSQHPIHTKYCSTVCYIITYPIQCFRVACTHIYYYRQLVFYVHFLSWSRAHPLWKYIFYLIWFLISIFLLKYTQHWHYKLSYLYTRCVSQIICK